MQPLRSRPNVHWDRGTSDSQAWMNFIIARCAWNWFEAMGVSTQLAWVTLDVNPSIVVIEAQKVFHK
jgi:hypothetical protein